MYHHVEPRTADGLDVAHFLLESDAESWALLHDPGEQRLSVEWGGNWLGEWSTVYVMPSDDEDGDDEYDAASEVIRFRKMAARTLPLGSRLTVADFFEEVKRGFHLDGGAS